MIDPHAVPPILTSVVLRFVLVACSFLDGACSNQQDQTQPGQSFGLRTEMSTSKAAEARLAGSQEAPQRSSKHLARAQQTTAISLTANAACSSAELLPYSADSPKAGSSSGKVPHGSKRSKSAGQTKQPQTELRADNSKPQPPVQGRSPASFAAPAKSTGAADIIFNRMCTEFPSATLKKSCCSVQ